MRRPPWFEVYEEQVRLPSGRVVDDFWAISIPDFVVIAGFDQAGNVLVERHYRHGAKSVTLSLPSGYIDPGEDPVNAAKRELIEETGFEARSWKSLGRFVVDGNRGCGWAHLFLAEDLTKVGSPSSGDLADIDVSLLPYQEVVDYLLSGGIAELAIAAALGIASIKTNQAQLPRRESG